MCIYIYIYIHMYSRYTHVIFARHFLTDPTGSSSHML